MYEPDPAPLENWLVEPPDDAVKRSLDRLRNAGDAVRVAVMPDVHLSHDVCVGAVLATRERLYPAAVGGDIGCGMAARRFPGAAEAVPDEATARRVLAALRALVPIRSRRKADRLPWPADLDPDDLSAAPLIRLAGREGRQQLGTIGRGNHFVELQADDEGDLWATVHTGSRSMGPAIGRWHCRRAAVDRGSGLAWLDAESSAGRAYLGDMTWAIAYAAANRRLILAAVQVILQRLGFPAAEPDDGIACTHNGIWREDHGDGPLWVHRKGAVRALAGAQAVIPGSMGTASYHVIGRGCPAALGSASHGAGRALSRSAARRVIDAGAVRRQMRGVWFADERAGQLVEEAPAAYKDISAVMRAQRPLVRIVRRLRPVLNYKGT